MFRCYHCPEVKNVFKDAIAHTKIVHPTKTLSIRKKYLCDRSGNFKYQSVHFPKCIEGTKSTVEDNFSELQYLQETPPKCLKTDNNPFISKRTLEASTQTEAVCIAIDNNTLSDEDRSSLDQACSNLPDFLNRVKTVGHLREWACCFQAIASNRFPLNNIAYILFLDVIRWFSNTNSCAMRYSDGAKLFWKTGLRLFKGRFLRFMSGLKNQGQVISQSSKKGYFDPQCSGINFAVPSRNTLETSDKGIESDCAQPGIITSLLDDIARQDQIQRKTYKLSVDLKKLNPGGSNGDVNMIGFEKSPTLMERKNRLTSEVNVLDQTNQALENISDSDEPKRENHSLLSLLRKTVQILANRVRDLREIRVKRKYAFDKCKEESGDTDWQKSRYALYMSSLQTAIFKIDNSVQSLLTQTNGIVNASATLTSEMDRQCNVSVVDLDKQDNYVCLIGIDEEMLSDVKSPAHAYCRYIKQRSRAWFKLREGVPITGSTAYKALGLESLKSQVKHFEQKFEGKLETPMDENVLRLIQHGVDNEINAIATVVSKVLPLFHPDLSFHEEGCYTINHEGKQVCIVSPDGSLRDKTGKAVFGVEIKCPNPENASNPTVMYSVPRYYVPQLLLEMKVLNTQKLLFVKYSPSTTTVMEVSFCNDTWQKLWTVVVDIYGNGKKTKPVKLHPSVQQLRKDLQMFSSKNVKLLCEVPSCTAKICHHVSILPRDAQDIVGKHGIEPQPVGVKHSVEKIQESLAETKSAIEEAYELCRHLAKQILVVMISDLDRLYKAEQHHAAPIAYALTDNSVTTDQLQNILRTVRHACKQRGLYIAAECYDGAFARLATRGTNNEPLTVLQLAKDVFAEAKSMSKAEQVRTLVNTGVVGMDNLTRNVDVQFAEGSRGAILAYKKDSLKIPCTPANSKQILKNNAISKPNHTHVSSNIATTTYPEANDLLEPNKEMEDLQIDNESGNGHSKNLSNPSINDSVNWEHVLDALRQTRLQTEKRKGKQLDVNLSNIEGIFATAAGLSRALNKSELISCGKAMDSSFSLSTNMKKAEIVNTISERYGCGSVSSRRTTKVKSLKQLAKTAVHKLPKVILNVVIAELMFPERLREWQEKSPIKAPAFLKEGDPDGYWYSQPKYLPEEDRYIFCFLDPEHMLTNTRTKVCSTGIKERNISNVAWVTVAKNCKENDCGLNPSLVEDLADKQNCSFALATFSEKVQDAMTNEGYHSEAHFCSLIRNWHRAQDEPGLSASERHLLQTDMKQFLLQDVSFGKFPPAGSHVRGIPAIMFEGLVIHCERRTQLYAFTRSGTYNPRSIGTLDNENFFGAFQDFDAKGTGILHCSEVPLAMTTACELYSTRHDLKRGFYMHTTKAKVYPQKDLMDTQDEFTAEAAHEWKPPTVVHDIVLRNHQFDGCERAARKAKRKRSSITPSCEPARGTLGVRSERFRLNESKIPCHVREGIDLSQLLS